MLSGALLLPVKNESIGNFFRKRFTKVAIPLVVYYILYIVAKEGLVWLRPDHWILMLRRILTGAPMEAPHFWLVYVIIWLYVLTPFMRYIVHNIPDTVLSGVIGVVFAICALDTYLPLYGINSVFGIVVDSYAGTFLLGYFLSEKCSRKVENFFMFTGFLFAHNDVFYGSYLFVGKAPCVPKNKKQFLCAVDQPVQLFYSADPLGRTSFCGQTETACQCARRWHCRRLYCDDGTDSFYLSNRCNDP